MGGSTEIQNAKSDSEKAKEKLGVPNFISGAGGYCPESKICQVL